MRKKSGFTLIELLIVIAIISIIAVLGMIALGNARMKSRDAKRVADIKQVQVALEMFYDTNNRYPTVEEWNTGTIVSTSSSGESIYYIASIPEAPMPADGDCSVDDNSYSYTPGSDEVSYSIEFCLGANTGTLDVNTNGGLLAATELGISYLGAGSNAVVSSCLEDPSNCSWQALTPTTVNINNPQLFVYNGVLNLIGLNDDDYIQIMRYENNNWTTLSDSDILINSYYKIDSYQGVPYILYNEDYDWDEALSVQKYENGSWQYISDPGFIENGDGYDIDVSSGVPYVVYQDGSLASQGGSSVQKYEGGVWSQVGSSGFSSGAVAYTAISVYNSIPYVAYSKSPSGLKINVQKYENNSWSQVGTGDFSTGAAIEIDLVVDSNGPWVRYLDGGNAYWETIMNYTGGSWQLAGTVLESKDAVMSSYNNILYTAYNYGDYGAGDLAKVKYLSNNQWQALGSIGVTDSNSSWITITDRPSISIDNDITYLAFMNISDDTVYIMKFAPTP